MGNHPRWTSRCLTLSLLLGLAVLACAAGAVPPVGALQPANNYGTVTMTCSATTDKKGNPQTVCTFVVTNTQPVTHPATGYGIKGLIVYSPYSPIAISAPPRCQTTLYQKSNQYSWWDFNGSADTDGDGLPDSFIEPGQTYPGSPTVTPFTLTYNIPINQLDPSKFTFGLHVVVPFTGNTFFALAGGQPPQGMLNVTVTSSSTCVESGVTSITYTYQICNTGTAAVNGITVTDSFGEVATGLSIPVNQCVTETRTITITTQSTVSSFQNTVNITGMDTSGTTVTTGGQVTTSVCHPSLSVTKSASATTVLTGGSVTYTYVVKNTSPDVGINNITLTDSVNGGPATTIASIGSLAPGQSTTFSSTTNNLTQNTTDTAQATGTDTCAGGSIASNQATVTVTVISPQLLLSAAISANQSCIDVGDTVTVTVTYTLSNPGAVDLTNVVITDNYGSLPAVLTLASGTSTQVTRTITINSAQTVSASATASGTATLAGFSESVPSNPTSTSINIPACALLTGQVDCSSCGCGIAGVTVSLVDSSNNTVKTTTTDNNGNYSFNHILHDGSYTVQATSAPDFNPGTTSSFAYTDLGPNVVAPTITLTPTPVGFLSSQALSGKVYFSNATFYQNADTTGITLTQTDLSNAAFASPGFTTSYKYNGYIPDFPELGHFGGTGEPTIWVFIAQPLLPENLWNNYSFTNQVGVYDFVGTGAVGTANAYTYRVLFSQPFTGPGTAYQYTLTGFQAGGSLTTPTVTLRSPVWIGGGTAPPLPPSGTVPAGWMAQAIGQFTLPPVATTNIIMNGSFQDACGGQFTPFSICPAAGSGPDVH